MKIDSTEFPKDITYSKIPTRTVGRITATLPEGIEVVSESNNRLVLNNKTSLALSCRIVDRHFENDLYEPKQETWRKKSKKQKGNNKLRK